MRAREKLNDLFLSKFILGGYFLADETIDSCHEMQKMIVRSIATKISKTKLKGKFIVKVYRD